MILEEEVLEAVGVVDRGVRLDRPDHRRQDEGRLYRFEAFSTILESQDRASKHPAIAPGGRDLPDVEELYPLDPGPHLQRGWSPKFALRRESP